MVKKSDFSIRFDKERRAVSEVKGLLAQIGRRCDGAFGAGTVEGVKVASDFSISVEVRADSVGMILVSPSDIDNVY